MTSSSGSDFSAHGVETTTIETAPGVTLSDQQKLLTGCVYDLFAGRPSLRKLQLWKDNGVFVDPLTIAEGRKQYQAQWYGLRAAFSEISSLHRQVTSAGNPIEIDMKTKYVVKGLGTEKIIQSKIKIWNEDGKITKVEDRWDDNIPEGAIAKVGSLSY